MRQGFTLIELMIVIAIIAIIAAIAIPNLLESRVTANEAAASASLKSGVFPAQVQFQAGGYQDADADNVGEYGVLRALAGLQATNKIDVNSIHLLTGPLATSSLWTPGSGVAAPAYGLASGYAYTSFVPSTTDAAQLTTMVWCDGVAAPVDDADDTTSCNNGEKFWVAVCAPERFGDTGRRPFVITEDGQIRSPATSGGLGVFFGAVGGATTTTLTTVTNGTPISGARLSEGTAAFYNAAQASTITDTFDFSNALNKMFPVFAK
jgi:prepilin-type N-terminal cleavage/methylation domain-containing protein